MRLIFVCLLTLFLSGCIHIAVVSFMKETASIWYYDQRIKNIEKKKDDGGQK